MTMKRLKELIRGMWLVGVERADILKGLEDLSEDRRNEALRVYDDMNGVYLKGLKAHNIG